MFNFNIKLKIVFFLLICYLFFFLILLFFYIHSFVYKWLIHFFLFLSNLFFFLVVIPIFGRYYFDIGIDRCILQIDIYFVIIIVMSCIFEISKLYFGQSLYDSYSIGLKRGSKWLTLEGPL